MAVQQSKKRRLIFFALAILAVSSLCDAAASQMRPGQWEVTVRMDMPGMPPGAQKPQTITQCITPELASNPRASVEKFNARDQGDMKCTMSHFDVSGNKATWSIDCAGSRTTHMDGEVIYDSDTVYHGTTKMAMQGPRGPTTMKQEMQARRIGECR